jgi:hypothetical protein
MSEIVIYKSDTNQIEVSVQLDKDTVWLNQSEITRLFERDQSVISRHINNVFKEGELNKKSNMQKMHIAKSDKPVAYYSLDVIISVGYRVKSQQGTQFRIWANQVLKDYLVKGYAINQMRLAQKEEEIQILKNGISILGRVIEEKTVQTDNAWIKHFAKGLSLLDDYDHENLDKKGSTTRPAHYPTLQEYQQLVNQMRSEFDSDVFGKEKDNNFQSSIAQITKGFGERDFYPSIEEKAATLLYLVTKNHSFVDGNKRIAAACFLKFLEANNMLINQKQASIIGNDTLASLTLFIASSKPEEMETVKQLVVSVLNRNK